MEGYQHPKKSLTALSTVTGNNRYIYLISVIAAVGAFLLTYDIIIMSGAIIFLRQRFALTPAQVGFAMTSAILACLFSPSLGGWLADRFGRKRTLMAAAGIFALAALGTALPRSILEFNVFRFIGGFGVGAACIVSPMYIAEIAPADVRGRLVLITQLANVVGALIAYLVTYIFSFTGNWRCMFGSTAIPGLIFLFALAFVPESPRWLIQKRRKTEALDSIRRLATASNPEAELNSICLNSDINEGKLLHLFRPGIRVALLIAVGLAVFTQFDGVTVLLFYAPTIMQQAGFHRASEAILLSLILGFWNLGWTGAAIWLVDRAGRKPLLLFGSIGMAMGMGLMGVFFRLHMTGIALPVIMMLAVASYSVSLAPVSWLVIAEVFPTHLRSLGMAFAATALWIADFAASFSFPLVTAFWERRFGSAAGMFWIFSSLCLATFIFCWRFVPETKGKTLEEIAGWWTPSARGFGAS